MDNETITNSAERDWANDILMKIDSKMQSVVARNENKIPYEVIAGHYDNMATKNISWWTNGFFAGSLWQLYYATKSRIYRESAENIERQLDRAFKEYYGLHHDVGFMFLHTAVADYRLTKNESSKKRALQAANLLAGRFNVKGQFIRSWNKSEYSGWSIIDSLMNITILYWASSELGDPRYREIAMRHADTLLNFLVRPDGSVGHIAEFDPESGDFLRIVTGQGYDAHSAWARGQAWALYGYSLSYLHTKQDRYLDAAKRIANFYIANVSQTNYLSLVDFRAPYPDEKKYDASAGVCAACGLLQLSDLVPKYEKNLYYQAGYQILLATVDHWCDWDVATDGIVGMASHSYHQVGETHVKLVYSDYFLIEGILRLLKKDFLIW